MEEEEDLDTSPWLEIKLVYSYLCCPNLAFSWNLFQQIL